MTTLSPTLPGAPVQAPTRSIDDVLVSIDSVQAVAGYQTIECGTLPPVPGDSPPALRPTTYAGCGGLLSWVFAYRCVDCGLFFHHACILRHFETSKDIQP